MIDKIVAQLKTGRIKNVVPFGNQGTPPPPYIVVKPEATGNGTNYRIIVHMMPGQQIFLEDYIKNDISDLLDGFGTTTRNNNYNEIETLNEYTDIIISNDDETISMERVFEMPSIIF